MQTPYSKCCYALLVFVFALTIRAADAQTAYAVDASNNLLKFSVTAPGMVSSSKPITGLGTDVLADIDFRPANGQLYALAGGRLYTINVNTGAATLISAIPVIGQTGPGYGIDFNPTVDRIRVVSETDQNVRLNPDTGALAAMDTALAYATGDINFGMNPNVASVAYSSNFAGATTTTLYGIDSNRHVLVTHSPPNNGTLNTVGNLGVNVFNVLGFDILTAGGTDTGYAILEENGQSRLYRINLVTGAATLIGAAGNGSPLRGLAVTSELDYTGPWYNAGESGWGLSVFKGGSGAYGIVMYHFNQPRAPTWYFMAGGTFSGTVYNANVTTYTGPWYGEPFSAAPVNISNVGTVSINFTSESAGTITYTISGVTVTKSITKLTF